MPDDLKIANNRRMRFRFGRDHTHVIELVIRIEHEMNDSFFKQVFPILAAITNHAGIRRNRTAILLVLLGLLVRPNRLIVSGVPLELREFLPLDILS